MLIVPQLLIYISQIYERQENRVHAYYTNYQRLTRECEDIFLEVFWCKYLNSLEIKNR